MRIRRKRVNFRTSTPARTGPHLADVVFGREGGGKWAPAALFGHTPAACLPNAPFSRQSPAQPRRGRPARALRRTPAGPCITRNQTSSGSATSFLQLTKRPVLAWYCRPFQGGDAN